MTPNQLFITGVLQLRQRNLTAFDFFNTVDNNYGIDTDDMVSNDDDDDEGVSIPRPTVQLSEHQLRDLQSHVNPQTDDGNHGINHYQQVLQYLNQQLQTA